MSHGRHAYNRAKRRGGFDKFRCFASEVADEQRHTETYKDELAEIFNKVFVDCEVAEIAKNALAAIREKTKTKGE